MQKSDVPLKLKYHQSRRFRDPLSLSMASKPICSRNFAQRSLIRTEIIAVTYFNRSLNPSLTSLATFENSLSTSVAPDDLPKSPNPGRLTADPARWVLIKFERPDGRGFAKILVRVSRCDWRKSRRGVEEEGWEVE